jgi:hypothetical protein
MWFCKHNRLYQVFGISEGMIKPGETRAEGAELQIPKTPSTFDYAAFHMLNLLKLADLCSPVVLRKLFRILKEISFGFTGYG